MHKTPKGSRWSPKPAPSLLQNNPCCGFPSSTLFVLCCSILLLLLSSSSVVSGVTASTCSDAPPSLRSALLGASSSWFSIRHSKWLEVSPSSTFHYCVLRSGAHSQATSRPSADMPSAEKNTKTQCLNWVVDAVEQKATNNKNFGTDDDVHVVVQHSAAADNLKCEMSFASSSCQGSATSTESTRLRSIPSTGGLSIIFLLNTSSFSQQDTEGGKMSTGDSGGKVSQSWCSAAVWCSGVSGATATPTPEGGKCTCSCPTGFSGAHCDEATGGQPTTTTTVEVADAPTCFQWEDVNNAIALLPTSSSSSLAPQNVTLHVAPSTSSSTALFYATLSDGFRELTPPSNDSSDLVRVDGDVPPAVPWSQHETNATASPPKGVVFQDSSSAAQIFGLSNGGTELIASGAMPAAPLDVGQLFSGGGAITFWMKADENTDGFVFGAAEFVGVVNGGVRQQLLHEARSAFHDVKDDFSSEPTTSSAGASPIKLKSTAAGVGSIHLYGSVYLDGQSGHIAFIHSALPSDVAVAGEDQERTLKYSVLRWKKEDLFDGNWHFVALSLGIEHQRHSVRLFIDGKTSHRDTSWRMCFAEEFSRLPSFEKDGLRKKDDANPITIGVSNELNSFAFFGGAMTFGYLFESSSPLALYGMQFHAHSLSHKQVTALGTSAMADHSSIEAEKSRMIGALLFIAVVGAVGGIIWFYWWNIALPDQFAGGRKRDGLRKTVAGAKAVRHANSALAKLEAIFPIFLNVAQGMSLMLAAMNFPEMFRVPFTYFFIVFSFDWAGPVGTPIMHLIIIVSVAVVLGTIGRKDTDTFEKQVLGSRLVEVSLRKDDEDEEEEEKEMEVKNDHIDDGAQNRVSDDDLLVTSISISPEERNAPINNDVEENVPKNVEKAAHKKKKKTKQQVVFNPEANIPEPSLFPHAAHEFHIQRIEVNEENGTRTAVGKKTKLSHESGLIVDAWITTAEEKHAGSHSDSIPTPDLIMLPLEMDSGTKKKKKQRSGEDDSSTTKRVEKKDPNAFITVRSGYVTPIVPKGTVASENLVAVLRATPGVDFTSITNVDDGVDDQQSPQDGGQKVEKKSDEYEVCIHTNARRCPVHGNLLIPILDEAHGEVPLLPNGEQPYRCAMNQSRPFRRVHDNACDDHLMTCPIDSCGFTVCSSCVAATGAVPLMDRVGSAVASKMYSARRAGVFQIVGLVAIIIAETMYLPSVRSSFLILSCHPQFVCDFPYCYDHVSPMFGAVAACCVLIIVVLGIGFLCFEWYMIIRRKLLVVDSGLWNEVLVPPRLLIGAKFKKPVDPAAVREKEEKKIEEAGEQIEEDVSSESRKPDEEMGAKNGTVAEGGEAPKTEDDKSLAEVERNGDSSEVEKPPTAVGFTPTTLFERLFCGMANEDWQQILRRDRSMLRGLYEQFEFHHMAYAPFFLVFKFLIVTTVITTVPNSITQLVATSCVEVVNCFLIGSLNPMREPWLNILARVGNVHQMTQLAFLSFHRIEAHDDPNAVGLAPAMIVVALLFVVITIAVIVTIVVKPYRQAKREEAARREARKKKRQEEAQKALESRQRVEKKDNMLLLLRDPEAFPMEEHATILNEGLEEYANVLANKTEAEVAEGTELLLKQCNDGILTDLMAKLETLPYKPLKQLAEEEESTGGSNASGSSSAMNSAATTPKNAAIPTNNRPFSLEVEPSSEAANNSSSNASANGEHADTEGDEEKEWWDDESEDDGSDQRHAVKTSAIRHLRFHNCMKAEHVKPLSTVTKKNNNIVTIDLSYNRHLPMEACLGSLRPPSQTPDGNPPLLTRVVLRGVRKQPTLGADISAGFDALISNNKQLVHFDFSENYLWNPTREKGGKVVKGFFELFRADTCSVKELVLDKMMPPAGGVSLKTSLVGQMQRDTRLTLLSIANNSAYQQENVATEVLKVLMENRNTRIETLDVSNTGVKDATMVVSCVKKIKTLKHLNISRNELTNGLQAVSGVLMAAINKPLKSLNLSECFTLSPAEEHDLKQMLELQPMYSTVAASSDNEAVFEPLQVELDDAEVIPMYDCITEDGAVLVKDNVRVGLKSIAPSKKMPLHKFSLLGRNRVPMSDLTSMLFSSFLTVKELIIRDNRLGDAFGTTLASALENKYLPCLEHLDVSNNSIGVKGLNPLLAAVPLGHSSSSSDQHQLSSLSIGGNVLADEGIAILSEKLTAAADTCLLEHLGLSMCQCIFTGQLTRIGGSDKKSGALPAFNDLLLTNLAGLKHLKSISLSGVGLSQGALKPLKQLVTSGTLQALDISGNKLPCTFVAELLNDSGDTLQALNAAGCALGAGAKGSDLSQLAGGIRRARQLKELNLASNQFDTFDYVAQSLETHPHLTALNISFNPAAPDLKSFVRPLGMASSKVQSLEIAQAKIDNKSDDPWELLHDLIHKAGALETVNVQGDLSQTMGRIVELELSKKAAESCPIKTLSLDLGNEKMRKRNVAILGYLIGYSRSLETLRVADALDISNTEWMKAIRQNVTLTHFTQSDRYTASGAMSTGFTSQQHHHQAATGATSASSSSSARVTSSANATHPFEEIEARNMSFKHFLEYAVGSWASTVSAEQRSHLSTTAAAPEAKETDDADDKDNSCEGSVSIAVGPGGNSSGEPKENKQPHPVPLRTKADARDALLSALAPLSELSITLDSDKLEQTNSLSVVNSQSLLAPTPKGSVSSRAASPSPLSASSLKKGAQPPLVPSPRSATSSNQLKKSGSKTSVASPSMRSSSSTKTAKRSSSNVSAKNTSKKPTTGTKKKSTTTSSQEDLLVESASDGSISTSLAGSPSFATNNVKTSNNSATMGSTAELLPPPSPTAINLVKPDEEQSSPPFVTDESSSIMAGQRAAGGGSSQSFAQYLPTLDDDNDEEGDIGLRSTTSLASISRQQLQQQSAVDFLAAVFGLKEAVDSAHRRRLVQAAWVVQGASNKSNNNGNDENDGEGGAQNGSASTEHTTKRSKESRRKSTKLDGSMSKKRRTSVQPIDSHVKEGTASKQPEQTGESAKKKDKAAATMVGQSSSKKKPTSSAKNPLTI